MMPGTLERNLRKCNRNLRILPSADLHRLPSGIFIPEKGELKHICGVDNIDIPEHGVEDWEGHIIKRGWRMLVEILIANKYIKKNDAERVFNTRFNRKFKPSRKIGKKPVNLEQEIQKEMSPTKAGGVEIDPDLLGDFAHEIRKIDPIEKPKLEDIYNGR